MGLLSLPNELLLVIAGCLSTQLDVCRFLRVNRRLSRVVGDFLLLQNIKNNDSSALLWAVRCNQVEVVRRMVDFGADLNAMHESKTGRVETPLRRAVEDGNVRIVKILAEAGARVLLPSPNRSPLQLAFDKGDEQITRILLDQMKGVNRLLTFSGETPLYMACAKGLVDTTRYLLDKGADPNWYGLDLGSHYATDVLLCEDTDLLRPVDKSIEILGLLMRYGLKLRENLRAVGREHSDPRVRRLFCDGILYVL